MSTKSADLMKDALEMSMEMILENLERDQDLRHQPRLIALSVLPFIKLAAKKRDRRHTEEQKSIVIEQFQIAMLYYGQLTGMQGITSIDLTVPVT